MTRKELALRAAGVVLAVTTFAEACGFGSQPKESPTPTRAAETLSPLEDFLNQQEILYLDGNSLLKGNFKEVLKKFKLSSRVRKLDRVRYGEVSTTRGLNSRKLPVVKDEIYTHLQLEETFPRFGDTITWNQEVEITSLDDGQKQIWAARKVEGVPGWVFNAVEVDGERYMWTWDEYVPRTPTPVTR